MLRCDVMFHQHRRGWLLKARNNGTCSRALCISCMARLGRRELTPAAGKLPAVRIALTRLLMVTNGYAISDGLEDILVAVGATARDATMETASILRAPLWRWIHRPPASGLLAITGFFCSRKTQERVFRQIVGDMRDEYLDALEAGRRWNARWIRLRGTVGFVNAMWSHGLATIVKFAVRAWKLIP